MIDVTGKLSSRKRELFILYCVASLKDSHFSICSESGTDSKEVAPFIRTDNVP